MDSGGGIRTGRHVHARSVGAGRHVQAVAGLQLVRWLAARWSVRGWYGAAAVALAVSVSAALGSVVLSGVLATLALVVIAGASLSTGIAALSIAALARRMELNVAGDRSRLLDERRRQITALLQDAPDGTSVTQAVHRLGWLEEAVVTTLKSMVDEHEVVEDLDVEAGVWVYRLASPGLLAYEPATLDAEHLTIAERAATVEVARRS